MSVAHHIALYLASQSVGIFGGNSGWSINVSREPTSPNDAITVYDTGGAGPDTDELDIGQNTFQVRVRSASYTSAYSKQKQIQALLLSTSGIVSSGVRYLVNVETDVLHIGRDDNDRQILTANYRALSQSAS